MRYQKKPIVIEAVQYTGDNFDEIYAFTQGACSEYGTDVVIHTLEGMERATPDYYIIKGVRGKFYPCEESIFNETYTDVDTMPYGIMWTEEDGKYWQAWPSIASLEACKRMFKRHCDFERFTLSENGLFTQEQNDKGKPLSFIQVVNLSKEVALAINRLLQEI